MKKVILILIVIVIAGLSYNNMRKKSGADDGGLFNEGHRSTANLNDQPNDGEPRPRSSRRKIKSRDMLSERARNELETLQRNLEKIEVDPAKYPELSYNDYYQEVSASSEKAFAKITRPSTLELVFWRGIEIKRTFDEGITDQHTLQWQFPEQDYKASVLGRLSQIKTDEATMTAVKLRFHPDAGWDGGHALIASQFILNCGPAAIPYLRQYDHHEAQRLIKLIESGAKSAM